MFADAHLHLSDVRISSDLQERYIRDAFKNNITYFLEAGVSPDGWSKQIELSQKYPENILCSFGLHPYWVAQNDYDLCEQALDDLVLILNKSVALGETGLDFREKYVQDGAMDRQIVFFENQIQIANIFKKPLILHIVKAHQEALRTLMMWREQLLMSTGSGLLHAFNGTYEVAKSYLDYGFMISIGGAITYSKNASLREAVKKIPIDMILIESDSPDQKPLDWPEPLNSPLSVLNVASVVAEMKRLSQKEVLQTTTANFKRLFR